MDTLLATWHAPPATAERTATVLPDGCRDLIVRIAPGEAPHWFVSSLDDCPRTVPIRAGVTMRGFRLQPGVGIDRPGLLASVRGRRLDGEAVRCRIAHFTHRPAAVAEALDCLASDVGSVARAARLLGVAPRTLQRRLIRDTGRSPGYWLMLARVRKAARAVGDAPLVELAARYGFADQAHMSRAFRRWLHTTPSALGRDAGRRGLLHAAGYG